MEDQERGMESNGRMTSPVKRKNSKPEGLTIMIIGSVGKIRSLRVSIRTFLWAFLFLLLYIPVSVFIINSFFEIRYRNKNLLAELDQLKAALEDSRQAYHRSVQHVTLLEDFLTNTEKSNSKGNEALPAGSITKETSGADKINNDLIPSENKRPEYDKIVDIQDIVIQKEGSLIVVDFKLVNLQPKAAIQAGYIHIIAESRNDSSPKVWTYPKEQLKDGFPADYRKGELFIIKRFKPIQGRLDLLSINIPPSIIRVLVYDQSGKLNLEKEFEVGNAP